jgi:hypothetical protein
MADKTVTGKTAGVIKEIIDFLGLVAKYGGKDVEIISGKREPSDQADAMYKNWTGTIDRRPIDSIRGSAPERATSIGTSTRVGHPTRARPCPHVGADGTASRGHGARDGRSRLAGRRVGRGAAL